MARSLAGCLLLALALAGGAAAASTIDKTVTLDAPGPGAQPWAEENLEGEAGDLVSYEWARLTSGDVLFDAHGHTADGSVTYLVGPDPGPTGSGEVAIPDTGIVSFFWENKGNASVEISYTINGGGVSSGNGIPGPALLLALSTLGVVAWTRVRR